MATKNKVNEDEVEVVVTLRYRIVRRTLGETERENVYRELLNSLSYAHVDGWKTMLLTAERKDS